MPSEVILDSDEKLVLTVCKKPPFVSTWFASSRMVVK